MQLESLVSAIQNNIVSGLGGASANNRFSLEQIEDEVIAERLAIIRKYSAQNIIPKRDLLLTISCLPVDCKSIDNCCRDVVSSDKIQHIEIPQTINDYGNEAVEYLGSVDRAMEFTVYYDHAYLNHKYRRRHADRPYAWINTTPNSNNFYDVFIFNAPMLKRVTITAMFKDPRQLIDFTCCTATEIYNISFIDREIERNVTESFIRYYRQMATTTAINDQTVKP